MEIERAGGALELPGDALEVSAGVVLLVQDAELSILLDQVPVVDLFAIAAFLARHYPPDNFWR